MPDLSSWPQVVLVMTGGGGQDVQLSHAKLILRIACGGRRGEQSLGPGQNSWQQKAFFSA